MPPLVQEALILIAVALAGAAVPLVVKRRDRPLHLLVALATGVFLGVVFLHLLPEVRAMAQGAAAGGADGEILAAVSGQAEAAAGEAADGAHDHDHAEDALGGHRHGRLANRLWLCVLIGVAGLFVLENLIFKSEGHVHQGGHHPGHDHGGGSSDRSRHVALGWAALLGLAVHSFTAGLGLAAAHTQEGLAGPVFVSIASHKATESFSLSTVFLLAGFPLVRILALACAFALTTPAAMFLGSWLVGDLSLAGVQVLTALAAGTFLYVAVGDLLPEVFHNRVDTLLRLVLVAAGVALSVFLQEVGP